MATATLGERQIALAPDDEWAWQAGSSKLPDAADVPLVETWAGMIETPPDVLPIMSAVRDLDGNFVATGFSGHCFGIGPGAAQAMADLVTGASPKVDLAPFRLERFFDGSPILPGPTI